MEAWRRAQVSLDLYLRGFLAWRQRPIENSFIQCLLHLNKCIQAIDTTVISYYKKQVPLLGQLCDELPFVQEILQSIHQAMIQQSKQLQKKMWCGP